jgi:hypothetical protein
MICRASRDRLALALRRYAAGRISNDDLDCVEVDRRDLGAMAVKHEAWFLYDDIRHHYATRKHAIDRAGRRELAKWVLFLNSDDEYLWPGHAFVPIVDWPLNLFTFGWWGRRQNLRRRQFEQAGDISAWPFITIRQLEDAVRRPRYFAGRSS